MDTLVTATATPITGTTAPAEIVFIPEGNHIIKPLSHPKGVAVNVPPDRGEEIAAAFNRQLQEARAGNVIPWTDFEHARKFPASGYPTGFRYERGKGVMVAMDWSGSGRQAIEQKDVRYFSPEFFVDENGIPSGFPTKGPVGGLVSEPAFRNIGPIAASLGIDAENEGGMKITAAQKIEAIAGSMVSAGIAPDINTAIADAIAENPELYRESLGQAIPDAALQEVEAMLKHLPPLALEIIKEKANELYLTNQARTKADSLVMAVQLLPHLYE